MTMTEIWDVIYLWEGERHRGGQHHSRSTAQAEVMAMRDAGWVCWMEYVGYRDHAEKTVQPRKEVEP